MSPKLLQFVEKHLTQPLAQHAFKPTTFGVSQKAKAWKNVDTRGKGFARDVERGCEFLYLFPGDGDYSCKMYIGWSLQAVIPQPSDAFDLPDEIHSEYSRAEFGTHLFDLHRSDGRRYNSVRAEGDEWFLIPPPPLGVSDIASEAYFEALLKSQLVGRTSSIEALQVAHESAEAVLAMAHRVLADVFEIALPYLSARPEARAR